MPTVPCALCGVVDQLLGLFATARNCTVGLVNQSAASLALLARLRVEDRGHFSAVPDLQCIGDRHVGRLP